MTSERDVLCDPRLGDRYERSCGCVYEWALIPPLAGDRWMGEVWQLKQSCSWHIEEDATS